MRRARSTAPTLLAALALAFPAGALAQGAGDTQYTDPLGGDDGQSQQGTGGGGQGGAAQGGGGQGGELRPSPPPGGEENGEARATERPTPEGQLPATGAEPGILALLGVGLILTGSGLRIRLRQPVG